MSSNNKNLLVIDKFTERRLSNMPQKVLDYFLHKHRDNLHHKENTLRQELRSRDDA